MKSRNILGGITALLFMGVFYIFAFSMVGSVEDMSMPPEYYDVENSETEPFETDIPERETTQKSEKKDKNDKKSSDESFLEDFNDSAEHIEAVPAMVTVTDVPERDGDSGTSAVTKTETEAEDNYPEDFDVDDYNDDDSEAEDYPSYAQDNDDDLFLGEDDYDEPFLDDDDDPPPFVTEPVYTNAETSPNIIVTLYNENEPPADEVKVTVNTEAAGSVNINANETFTARFDGAVQTVNAYDLICWIVNNEISTSFSDEAIKAQAVAAYSYVKYHNVKGLTPSVLVKKNPPQRIKDMVSSVWGVCCYYNGSVAQTVYMASSSGYTADAKNVWGGSVPYLKSVHCPLDAQYDPNYGSTMTVSESNMRSLLEGQLGITLSDNPSNWLVVTGYVDGNYVSEINVDGQKTISGRKMRENILNYKLKSAAFDVSYSSGTFTFTTYGYGHGVGMSQNGANILAKQGYTYTQILKFYFTGIEVL